MIINNDGTTNGGVVIWPNIIQPNPWRPWDQPWVPYVPPTPYIPPAPSILMPKQKARVTRKPAKPRARVVRHGKGDKETFITLILDKSGSMSSSRAAALSAINEQIDTIKENAEKGGKTYVSLVIFSDTIDVIFENVLADEVGYLEDADYNIGGSTALRDALNTAIDLMAEKQMAHKNQGFLTVLISDGQENASGTTKEALRARIAELEKTDKWTFTYMLDGHTWEAIQEVQWYANNSLNNISNYCSSAHGTYTGGQMLKQKLVGYMDARSANISSTKTFMGADGVDNTVTTDVTGVTPTSK